MSPAAGDGEVKGGVSDDDGDRAVRRADLRAVLARWRAGELDGAAVCGWARERWPRRCLRVDDRHGGGGSLSLVEEVLAELDLLAVHLLTVDDAPALEALLDAAAGEERAALARYRLHRDAIDRRARSRTLRRDPFYRPFTI